MLSYHIDKASVLSRLGYVNQEISDSLHKTIDDCIALSYAKIVPAFTYQTFLVHVAAPIVTVKNTAVVISSADLSRLLKYSQKAVFMALSAGGAIEQAIRAESYRDMTRCVILDSCASVAAEAMANAVEQRIAQEIDEQYRLTNRFSCGYGDFSLCYQGALLQLLNAEKQIGLHVGQSGILQPKKSITAVIGIVDKSIDHTHYATCATCAIKENCAYRKEGKTCFN